VTLRYENLDSSGNYVVRVVGKGEAFPRVNGQPLTSTLYGEELGEFKEFPVPRELIRDGAITLTWDTPPNEEQLNWRNRSTLAEVWLLKR